MRTLARLLAAWSLAACVSEHEPPRELAPIADPVDADDPILAPQPHRDRPSVLALDAEHGRLWVALQGTESEPGREVVALDARTFELVARIEVGPFPIAMAIHPGGHHLVVLSRFARYATVIDLDSNEAAGEVPTPYYSEAIAFAPDGRTAYVANRWRDAILRWSVAIDGGSLRARPEDDGESPVLSSGMRTLANPRRILVHGDRILVTSESDLAIAAYDRVTGEELARHAPNAPVTDAVVVGDYVVALHTGSGTGHPPATGRDGDQDGRAGDGTANVVFQDLQNEIDVLRAEDLALLHRYTSDTIAFRDYRDVDPDRPDAGLELPAPDTWPPDRARFLPPRATWIVAGAMPERVVAFARADGSPAIAVVYGGSSEVQTFDVGAGGSLSPREFAGGLYPTGMGAIDAAVDGRSLVVVARLGESLHALDLDHPPSVLREAIVGDVSGGPFPATDAELGEAFNTLTAPFTVDGDQTCVHCHRDGSPIGKDVSMPLLVDPAFGTRLVMSYRGAADSRPWFFEAGMDESNFFPVINELARRENFCCEGTDPRIWRALPSAASCGADPDLAGCNHVLHCEDEPPPACAERRYGSPDLRRDEHFRRAALRLFGRDTTFGDVLYTERLRADGTLERRPLALGFEGITRALGVFLRTRSRLLPNPNAALPSAEVALGRRLFSSSETGCSGCHPLPAGATAMPESARISLPFVVSPERHPDTRADVDRITQGFLGTFPRAAQDEAGLRIGVTSVRGVWDRVRFLHAGSASSLREVLLTPGHAALEPGERGRNERDGVSNTHGGTAHLDPREIRALEAFLQTL